MHFPGLLRELCQRWTWPQGRGLRGQCFVSIERRPWVCWKTFSKPWQFRVTKCRRRHRRHGQSLFDGHRVRCSLCPKRHGSRRYHRSRHPDHYKMLIDARQLDATTAAPTLHSYASVCQHRPQTVEDHLRFNTPQAPGALQDFLLSALQMRLPRSQRTPRREPFFASPKTRPRGPFAIVRRLGESVWAHQKRP